MDPRLSFRPQSLGWEPDLLETAPGLIPHPRYKPGLDVRGDDHTGDRLFSLPAEASECIINTCASSPNQQLVHHGGGNPPLIGEQGGRNNLLS